MCLKKLDVLIKYTIHESQESLFRNEKEIGCILIEFQGGEDEFVRTEAFLIH